MVPAQASRSGHALACPLCVDPGGQVLMETPNWRLVLVDDPDWPAYVRVIWNAHVRELSDLAPEQAQALMSVLIGVEQVMRAVLQPDKINLASLGNQVPHLHWHVIARWQDDHCFPASIWSQSALPMTGQAEAARPGDALKAAAAQARVHNTRIRLPELVAALRRADLTEPILFTPSEQVMHD